MGIVKLVDSVLEAKCEKLSLEIFQHLFQLFACFCSEFCCFHSLRAAVQYVPATAVLRALEVEKRVRDAAAAITVNRRVTESI